MTKRDRDCIFCRIASGDLGSTFHYESEHVVAFDDVAPQAPTHVLVIPRIHVPDLPTLAGGYHHLVSEMIYAATQVATELGLSDTGFRLLVNTGEDAGQTVDHVHVHVLGGGKLAVMG